jgi:hypothetical protein
VRQDLLVSLIRDEERSHQSTVETGAHSLLMWRQATARADKFSAMRRAYAQAADSPWQLFTRRALRDHESLDLDTDSEEGLGESSVPARPPDRGDRRVPRDLSKDRAVEIRAGSSKTGSASRTAARKRRGAGSPWVIAHPGLPQIPTCGFPASGSSS